MAPIGLRFNIRSRPLRWRIRHRSRPEAAAPDTPCRGDASLIPNRLAGAPRLTAAPFLPEASPDRKGLRLLETRHPTRPLLEWSARFRRLSGTASSPSPPEAPWLEPEPPCRLQRHAHQLGSALPPLRFGACGFLRLAGSSRVAAYLRFNAVPSVVRVCTASPSAFAGGLAD